MFSCGLQGLADPALGPYGLCSIDCGRACALGTGLVGGHWAPSEAPTARALCALPGEDSQHPYTRSRKTFPQQSRCSVPSPVPTHAPGCVREHRLSSRTKHGEDVSRVPFWSYGLPRPVESEPLFHSRAAGLRCDSPGPRDRVGLVPAWKCYWW